VAGERRWRAARQAGLEEVPAVVRPLSDREAAVLALVENLQREELGFFEEALAYQDVIQRFGLTQEELATLLGRQQSTIANKLRLLRLPPAVRERIVAAGLSERHARALLRLPTAVLQEAVLQEAVAGRWSVRQLEERIEAILGGEGGGEGPAPSPARGGARRRRRLEGLRAIKDVRILLNTVRAGVETLRRAGLDAQVEECEDDAFVEVRIRIPKGGRPSAGRGRRAKGEDSEYPGGEGAAGGGPKVAAPSR
ncbi:MAG TPA: ParB/RepB/Spo0J family partition protein, partial [Thermaerobacter sp.]